ncbi:MAG: hypothetical protein KIH69_019835 [Anaerolineae bacterium]|nr:hypothetical protein [Anaerolineae bacterium]
MPLVKNLQEKELKIGYKDWFNKAVKLDDRYEDDNDVEVEVEIDTEVEVEADITED